MKDKNNLKKSARLFDEVEVQEVTDSSSSEIKRKGKFNAREHIEELNKGKGPLDKERHGGALQRYFDDYEVVSQDDFGGQIKQIAGAIDKLTEEGKTYSIVTSKPGKSNFWVAEQVLEQTNKPPKSVYTMGTKEVSSEVEIEDAGKAALEDDLKNDNHVLIFLDDASYSGSQLSNVLKQFEGIASAEQIRIGQVARSEDALEKVKDIGMEISEKNDLATPIHIKKPNRADAELLNDVAKVADPKHFGEGSNNKHAAGLYQTAMFYKVPDYASTMDYIPIFENYEHGEEKEPYKQKDYLNRYYPESAKGILVKNGKAELKDDIKLRGVKPQELKQQKKELSMASKSGAFASRFTQREGFAAMRKGAGPANKIKSGSGFTSMPIESIQENVKGSGGGLSRPKKAGGGFVSMPIDSTQTNTQSDGAKAAGNLKPKPKPIVKSSNGGVLGRFTRMISSKKTAPNKEDDKSRGGL